MEKELPRHEELVDERLVFWYFMAALFFMFASMLGGLLMGLQLTRMNPFKGIELFSPGRWRMIHTNAIAYGFLANAFLGMLHWAVPRLTLRPVLSGWLSYAIFFAWQAVVVATAVGILFGQARDWNGARRRSGSTRSHWRASSWSRSISWRRSPRPRVRST